MIADAVAPCIQSNLILGTSIVYWITAPIVGIVVGSAMGGYYWKQFFSYTIPFVGITLTVCFVFALIIWIIPFAV